MQCLDIILTRNRAAASATPSRAVVVRVKSGVSCVGWQYFVEFNGVEVACCGVINREREREDGRGFAARRVLCWHARRRGANASPPSACTP